MLQKLRAGLPPPSFPLVLNSAANTVSTSLLACKHRCNIDACSCNIDATSLLACKHRCFLMQHRCLLTQHRCNIAATSLRHRCNKSLQNHCMVNVTSLQHRCNIDATSM